EHAARVVGVDDPGAAVAHLPAPLEHLGDDLDAAHVAARVEDLARVDDRVRHRLEIGHAAALGGGDPQHGEQHATGRVAHVVAQRDGVLHRTDVHRRVTAADVAVAQQTAP